MSYGQSESTVSYIVILHFITSGMELTGKAGRFYLKLCETCKMKITILGSGGCMPIPKPLCQCRICKEARMKGRPFSRRGPSIFLHDLNMLIDTPPQIFDMINSADLKRIDYLLYTHLDSDHFDGHSVMLTFYFDGLKYAYAPSRALVLIVPPELDGKLINIWTQYGRLLDFYLNFNILEKKIIQQKLTLHAITIVPIFVMGNTATSFIYLFSDHEEKKLLYAPCDTKPFPLDSEYVYDVDVFITQPGYFEFGLRDGFEYPEDDQTRKDLYSFDETLGISRRIRAKQVIFTHIEEYWNRSYSDYVDMEKRLDNVKFAYDGMEIEI